MKKFVLFLLFIVCLSFSFKSYAANNFYLTINSGISYIPGSFSGEVSGSFNGNASGSSSGSFSGSGSGSGTGSVATSSSSSNSLVFVTSGATLRTFTDNASNFVIDFLGSMPYLDSDQAINVSSLPSRADIYVGINRTTGEYFYLNGRTLGSSVLIPTIMNFTNGDTGNLVFDFGVGPFSGSFNETLMATFSGSYTEKVGYTYLPFGFNMTIDNYTVPAGDYFFTGDIQVDSMMTSSINKIQADYCRLYPFFTVYNLDVFYQNGYLYFSGHVFVPYDYTSNSIDIVGVFLIPLGANVTINSGNLTLNRNHNMFFFKSYENRIYDSLVSSGGASAGLANQNSQLSNTMSQYFNDTDTSVQYGNLSDDLFVFNTGIFNSVLSTITLFSSCISTLFTNLGDFGTVLLIFLTNVLVSCIIGITRYINGGD